MNPQKSILIVDDDATIRDTFALCLEMADYQVSQASDGQDALEVAARCSRLPDLILLDWMMPRKSGSEFMRERLAVPGLIDVPVIIISAHAHTRPDGAEQLLKSGARICLPKPIGVEALLQAIRLAIV